MTADPDLAPIAYEMIEELEAKAGLGWSAQYGIDEMCQDSWHFQQQNPDGITE